MIRTALPPRRTSLTRTGKLRPVSVKRARANRQRRRMVTALWPDRPACTVTERRTAAGMAPLTGCGGWGDDVHEILTRGRGGSITDPANVAAPCRPCHRHLTDTPDSELGWAYRLGLLAHSWPAEGDA